MNATEQMQALNVLQDLCNTVEAVGGIYYEVGRPVLIVDPDWLDLAVTYEKACAVLGKAPHVVPNIGGEDEEEGGLHE